MLELFPGQIDESTCRGIPFDKPLPKAVLDIDDKRRTNPFAWRGQFSPELVESLLNAYCPPVGSILDPFAGSGTLLLEAARAQLQATAVEINPAAWILTRVYTLANASQADRNRAISPAVDIFTAECSGTVSQLRKVLRQQAVTSGSSEIVISALVILIEPLSDDAPAGTAEPILRRLCGLIRRLPYSPALLRANRGDSRRLQLPPREINFVLTSPPYINVFNYHQHYRKAAESLGYNLLTVARSEIGSNRANRGNRFLTVVQFCIDMHSSLREIERVCSEGARVILVVGHESNVLGVPFYNADLVANLATSSGLFELVQKQIRRFRNKFGQTIREDLIHLTPVRGHIKEPDNQKAIARQIAEEALKDGLRVVAEKNRNALCGAIDRVNTVAGTPNLAQHESSSYLSDSTPRETQSLSAESGYAEG